MRANIHNEPDTQSSASSALNISQSCFMHSSRIVSVLYLKKIPCTMAFYSPSPSKKGRSIKGELKEAKMGFSKLKYSQDVALSTFYYSKMDLHLACSS